MPEDNLKNEETQEEGQNLQDEQEQDNQDERDEQKYILPDDESIPEKFRGKEPEEVVKSYVELEKMIERKAQEMTKAELEKRGLTLTDEKKKEIKEVTDDIDFTKIDFTKMSPQDFAKWIISEVDRRSEEKARTIVTESVSTREAVAKEISEAKAKHPQLENNEAYKEAVLAQIAFAKQNNKELTLEEACQKVDALMGVKEEEGVKEAEKVKRTGVEKTKPSDAGKNPTEDEKVLQGIMNAGQMSGGPLGGLGI